ncbi:MAG: PIG-L family deacetylase [Verrucomicrobia bacterium]|nr:PIG-L family deacetylase [Verrucomicrobiota bacterium]
MKTHFLSRRDFATQSLALGAPALLLAEALSLSAAEPPASSAVRKLKVVCVGGHPDDPESGCAGTLARYTALGHAATIIYLTRGEGGIKGKSHDEAAAVRSAECEAACKVIGAKPVFAGQIDGETEFNRARLDAFIKLLFAEEPDVVFTHWPIDTHMDHQVASFLTIRAQMSNPRRFHLYFFEVNTGSQTQGFAPNVYVDITGVVEKKKAALFAHASQDGEGIWRKHHEIVANFRGREAGVGAAEAFVHLNRDTQISKLPGL